MARHDEREAVACTDRPRSALRPRMSGETREIGIRDDLAVRDTPHRRDDVALERGPALIVDVDVGELESVALEVPAEPVDESCDFRRRAVADT